MILYFIVSISLIYLILIASLAFGMDKVNPVLLQDQDAKSGFSVVIPFRNEINNLPQLVASIKKLEYPQHLYELIFVDDDSEDNSLSELKDLTAELKVHLNIITNARTSGSPKKDAILNAINIAKFDWIVTTDADCELPKYWLDAMDQFIQNNEVAFIVAPVTYRKIHSFFDRFQLLDFLSLQGATQGGFGINQPFLCNGANLAYKKDLFLELNGFNNNDHLASGDDIFMLEKVLKRDKKIVNYLKCEHAIVSTKPEGSLKELIFQRMRWASKSSNYKNRFALLTGLLVFLMNSSIVILPLLVIMRLIPLKIALHIYLIKLCIDFLLLYKISRFFHQESNLGSYVLCSLIYPFFSVFIALISVLIPYSWKGRSFSK